MAHTTRPGDLFPEVGAPEGALVVNERCVLRTQAGHRVVLVAGVPLAQYALGDHMAEAHAMVSLVDGGWADQNDVARAFDCTARTLRRHQRRFEEAGLVGLGRPRGYPKGRPRLSVSRTRQVSRWKASGCSNRQIAARLGVSEKAVRKVLRRLGWQEPVLAQALLPLEGAGADPKLSAFAATRPARPLVPTPQRAEAKQSAVADEPLVSSMDADPSDRRLDRLMAYLGLLDDAAPIFRPGARVPGAGVLLAIPALTASGLVEAAREVYGTIGPAFYGLRTTMVTLVLMALLRIKRPEGLKERPPEDLGRILGLDRAPEVKTLRRKLVRLAGLGRAARLGRALAERRVAARGASLGFLYLDGHVRVYHGKETLPKAHVARMRLAMPATTDYWVNDAAGEPLFVVTAEANAGLAKMLPPVLDEVRALLGERQVTVVFDRGGWSPKLFGKLVAAGFDLLTYRKGPSRRVPRGRFREHAGTIDGRKVAYWLADQGIHLLAGKLRLRQVTRLSPDEHQTPIVTSRRDLSALEVAYRMFERWRQENFFKYLREEYALDALVEYAAEPDDPTREVPNPQWRALDAKLRAARAALMQWPAEYGLEAFLNPESRRPTMRGFKIAHGKLGQRMLAAAQRCRDLERKRAAVPKRLPVGKVVEGPVVKLAAERQHLTSLLKMLAYQAESDLVRLLAPHYRRADDEGRTLIQTSLASAADLAVSTRELRVTLAPLSSPHRTRAIAALCEELNAQPTRFPGTNLTVRYAVAPAGKQAEADRS